MAFTPAPGVARVVLGYSMYGQPLSNTMYFLDQQSPTAVRTANAANQMRDGFVTNVLPILSADLSLVRVTAYDLTSSSSPVSVNTSNLPQSGTEPASAEYRQGAMKLQSRTGGRGRAALGGFWLPGIPVNVITGNIISTPFLSDFTVAWNAVLQQMTDNDWSWVMYGTQRDNQPVSPAIITAITGYTIPTRARVLTRRRLN